MASAGAGSNRFRINKPALDAVYRRLNKREYVSPDPLEVLYDYPDVRDREIAAFVASSLALGKVKSIVKNTRFVLRAMDRPRRFVESKSRRDMEKTLAGFAHRWIKVGDLACLLSDIGSVVKNYGSLEKCFASGLGSGQAVCTSALARFAAELRRVSGSPPSNFRPDPARGSACKRLHLFLRWMVRRDEVDPGGWTCISPAMLTIPLDTHMFRISRALGLTARNTADAKCAQEITTAFRTVSPDDPVKYDFALTRLGIRTDQDLAAFVREYGIQIEGKASRPAGSSEFQG